MVTRYKGDPHWIMVKYPCVCTRCGKTIKKGDEAFYYPRLKEFFCNRGCGKSAEIDFLTYAEAEDYYGGKMRKTNKKARGMVDYYDYSPAVLSGTQMRVCKTCGKKTPHRKFAGKYYCDFCGNMYVPARKVKKTSKQPTRRKSVTKQKSKTKQGGKK